MFTVGFDIDGCMNNIKEDLVIYGQEFYDGRGKKAVINTKGYYFRDIFSDVEDDEYEEFWKKYGYSIYTNPPKEGVEHTITELKRLGVKVIAITTRKKEKKYAGQSFEKITTEWMKKYNISMPVFYNKDKVSIIQEQKVKIMVEDKPLNIEKLQMVTEVLIFKHAYNCQMNGEFVQSWKEILDKINGRRDGFWI